ncbi:MAG: Ni/Fe hydrogenase subunit alpha [Pseudomonadota bacterium]|uniref:Ni/Fe hydrogenase subunit alpha n=1 Tax=Thermithiobacillus tepidarius TaxID=929 RepID=UPI000401234A|nr:Ni/Fe hydrogenase subunit alpha [Thermithiobacillus tepidarius]
MTERRIDVPVLTRVEGEGALFVRIEGEQVADLRLRIFEPPRFFEKFLEGRSWKEVPDAVARICGICPVAYQMSAVHAIEQAFGVEITPEIRALRRLYYCGEWLESHGLHIHLLAAPDFLGYPDAMRMAKDYPDLLRRGMALQGLGNDIVRLFGGRPVNPVGARVGGFYRAPTRREMDALQARAEALLPEAEALLRWTAGLKVPAVDRDVSCVSLRHDHEYPMNAGRIVSSQGLDIDARDYEAHFAEFQVPHSTALHAQLHGQPYWVGPLPRLNNNLDRLPPATARLLAETGIRWPSANPYHSIVARAVEMHLALVEAIGLLAGYRPLRQGYVDVSPRAGVGMAATEAPRGILWHRYELDGQGLVRAARIVPPTSQNQAQMEADLRASVQENLGLDDTALRARLEADIRNYDPCISCSTHFLRLTVERA